MKDPAVAQAYIDAVSSCRKSATSLISQRDDPVGRAARLDAMSKLLDDKTIQSILEDSNKSMTKALNQERRVFVVKVSNTSGKNVVMRVEGGQVSTKISAGQTNLLARFPATGETAKKVVLFETDESGYVAQTSTIDIVGGGGAELTVKYFEPATVAVSLTIPTFPAEEPPVRVSYQKSGETQWKGWPSNPETLLPGEYDVKFARADYADILLHMQVPRGRATLEVKSPLKSDWAPSADLQVLTELQGLWDKKELAAFAKRLTDPAPKLDWPAHVAAYQGLKKKYDEQATKEVAEKLSPADAAVRAYCAYLYQVADPPEHKLRRLKEFPPIPEFHPELPDVRAAMINDAMVRAQYLRLKIWQDAAPGLKDDEGKDPLVKSLNQMVGQLRSLAPEVADRCQFESALLQWDYSGPVPSDAKTNQIDYWRWQAHSTFRPGDRQPEVLDFFALYVGRGGHPDRYDTILALYMAFYCWDNYVKIVQKKKDEGTVINDKGVEYNADKAYAEALKLNGPAARAVLKALVKVLSQGSATTVKESVDYLEGRRQENEALLMARCLGELPAFANTGYRQAVRKLKSDYDKTMTAEFNILKDLLESGQK